METLALAGNAMKSSNVSPVTFPAECFPTLLTLFSFPWSVTILNFQEIRHKDTYYDLDTENRGSPFI